MGLQHAVPVKETNQSYNDHLFYASSSMQGYRPEQEDAHCNEVNIVIDSSKNLFDKKHKFAMFAVFDGHAGGMASEYCSKSLLPCVIKNEEERLASLTEDANDKEKLVWGSDELFSKAYVKCDADLKDYHIANQVQPDLGAGTTSIVAYCRLPEDRTLPHEFICTNVGDSRAILYDGSSEKTVALSEDQKPSNEKEKARIEKAGKYVSMGRVQGNLAVARAFGDFRYKNTPNIPDLEQAVSVEPEVRRYEFTPVTTLTNEKYQFVVLACDGLWDKMSNSDVSSYICQELKDYQIFNTDFALTSEQKQPLQITWLNKQVVEWTSDDISAWLESIPGKYKRYFRHFDNGKELVRIVSNDSEWSSLMLSKEGLSNSQDFTTEIGTQFRNLVISRIEENEKNVAEKAITSVVDKLAFLTEKLIDYVVFKKRSEDNVSVTILLLKPTDL